jgi:hypothetical protein
MKNINIARANRAKKALIAYTGIYWDENDPETALADMIADLMHYADTLPPFGDDGESIDNWDKAVDRARGYHATDDED